MSAALIAKLESASEGSRELDAEMALLFGWTKQSDEADPVYTRRVTMWWMAPAESVDETTGSASPPSLTTSIDAALALAERVLPGWDWLLRTDENRGYMLNCWRRGDEPNLGDDCYPAYAKTPALALCIALLRASAAEGAGHD